MKHARAWMILLGLPAWAAAQSASPAGAGPAQREPAGAQQGAVSREQFGQPATALDPKPTDPLRPITRVPIPPEELGLTWGGMQWYPEVDLGLTYDTNLFATHDDVVADWSWTLTPSLVGRLATDNHELNVRLGVSAQRYKDNFRQNTDDAWADVQGSVKVLTDTKVFGGLSWSQTHEDRGSPDLSFGIEPTVYHDTSVNLGVFHDFGSNYARAGVACTRLDFDPVATSTAGVILDLNVRDRDVCSVGGRWGLRVNAKTDVFVQGVAEQRDYRRSVDLSGYERSSDGYRLDLGVAVDIDRHLVGEAYVGTLEQRYNDARFDPVKAVDLGLDLRWHASPWTTYWFGVDRTLDETVVAGSQGYLSTTASVRVEHDLNASTVFSGGVSVTRDRFQQITREDDQAAFNAGVRHYLNNSVYLGADFHHVHRGSDVLEANYDRSLFMLSIGTDFGARRRNRYFAYQDRSDALWPAANGNFSGVYLGVQAGEGMVQTDASGPRDLQPGNTDAGELGRYGTNLGLFAGVGWQIEQWYAGVDLSVQAGSTKLSHVHPNATEPLTYTIEEKNGWSAGLRAGRVLAGSNLVYARYGWSQTRFDNTMLNLDGSFDTSQSKNGRHVGIGTEAPLSDNQFVRMDYTVTRYNDYHLTTTSYDERYLDRSAYFFVGLGWRLGGKTHAPEFKLDPSYLRGVYGGLQLGHASMTTALSSPYHYHDTGADTLDANFGAMGTTTGGYLGLGWTFGTWYLGAELDADASHVGWTHERVTSGGGGGRDFSADKKWSYGGSLRAGYVLPSGALMYARVGTVRTEFNTRYSRGNSGTVNQDDMLEGMRWGLGMEVPLSRVTYLRMDYIATTYDDAINFTGLGANPDQVSYLHQDRTFRTGFGVRF
jgi:hypothetical protein